MRKDLDRVQGAWDVAALEVDGQSTSPPAGARIVIEGSRFASLGMGAVYEGTLQLDPAAKPARIGMKFDKGPEAGNTNLGIYQFKGRRRLRFAGKPAGVRPIKQLFTAEAQRIKKSENAI